MEQNFSIYFTSDIHGYLYPENYADRERKQLGLLAAACGFRKDQNTLVLDGGDMLQGSAFDMYCQKFAGDTTAQAEAMNAAGYDFVTIGNHDFNYGYDYLTGYLKKLHARAVCANLRIKKEEDRNLVQPYHIVRLENGLRVAVIGIVTDYVNVWEQKENLEYFEISSPYEALKQVIDEIGDRADLRVCIYHGGYEADLETGRILSTTGEDVGYKICTTLPVDILLTGHQHMAFSGKWINGTFTAQVPDKAQKYLHLSGTVYGDGLHVEAELVPVKEADAKAVYSAISEDMADTATEDTEQLSRVKYAAKALLPFEQKTQTWLDEPLGTLPRELSPDTKIRMAANGSPIADFINQIQLYYSGAQIACCGLANEVGGFRTSVTTRDVIASYPYPNTLMVLEIDGKTLRKALERTAEYFQPDAAAEDGIRVADCFIKPKVEHYNYDYFAGIDYVIDAGKPAGSRIVSLTRQGKPVEDTDTFSLCLNNYRASGAGGYEMYQGLKVIKEINTEMTELMIDYLGTHPKVELAEEKSYRVIW
ncbi:MAG: bifunctional UDP-sugar hydrolase/5'-nucleotidase [Eubacteriales bacterium]|nr:bifunctional UDP-sugar hydrolase/5'-nucleotidase [Eubacteriales bacterium]